METFGMVLKVLSYSCITYNMFTGRSEDALIGDCKTKLIFLPIVKFLSAGYFVVTYWLTHNQIPINVEYYIFCLTLNLSVSSF